MRLSHDRSEQRHSLIMSMTNNPSAVQHLHTAARQEQDLKELGQYLTPEGVERVIQELEQVYRAHNERAVPVGGEVRDLERDQPFFTHTLCLVLNELTSVGGLKPVHIRPYTPPANIPRAPASVAEHLD